MNKEKKVVKNNIAKRKDDDKVRVVDIKIDEKKPRLKEPGVPTNKKEAQAILDAYKARCKKFPVRMIKFEKKEKALKAWVESFSK